MENAHGILSRGIQVLLKDVIRRNWRRGGYGKEGCMDSSAEQRAWAEWGPVGLGVPLLIPCTCTAALTNSRTLTRSAIPEPPPLQCVSNPSTSPRLHLTPITQASKLLYLGLSSVFVFDNYKYSGWNSRAPPWRRVHSWFV